MLRRFSPLLTKHYNTASVRISITAARSMASSAPFEGVPLKELKLSSVYTDKLPPDPQFPTPAAARAAPASSFGPRQVQNALYTFVAPTPSSDTPRLLATTPAAFAALGLHPSAASDPSFTHLLAGNPVPDLTDIHPWAHCYGGWQFGTWARQLGDGRAISLFEATNPVTGVRWEVALKGAGMTPYSRFADGRAVLRSSIREFLGSEYLAATGVESTRALALVRLPGVEAARERMEPCAVLTRMAPSWVRIGTFDLFRSRGDRARLRALADYTATEVLHLGPPPAGQNRYEHLYRDIVRRNAVAVARWQAAGFMNGVLNTDNTSVLGLALDFGPFAFMDGMDAAYTPNHDDHTGRYRYDRQPTVIWWNLVRLGEDLAELFAAADCDDAHFVANGVREEEAEALVKRAEEIIRDVGEGYKAAFLEEYCALMRGKLGLCEERESDMDEVFVPCLDAMQTADVDFHHFFRALAQRDAEAAVAALLDRDENRNEAARAAIAEWLSVWRARLASEKNADVDAAEAEAAREERMKKVNPRYVPKGWVLDEIIQRVERKEDTDVLQTAVKATETCYMDEPTWEGITEEQKKDVERWCGKVPREMRGGQCSCSS
ncbi:hypothetical protein EDC01DRAFT_424394 [Geopyxis carbonaria]|nr:hypothetical protein EDC01DRAFT_424394 [Geopyxis carbonaria]